MLVGKPDELHALVPEELGEDEQGFIDVGAGEGERRRLVLRPRPVRQLWPDDAIALAINALASGVERDVTDAIDDGPPVPRGRHPIEFEAGEDPF